MIEMAQGSEDVDNFTNFDAGVSDILTDLGGDRGPGDYSFWLKALGSTIDYSVTLGIGSTAVPEISLGFALATLDLVGAVSRRRRS